MTRSDLETLLTNTKYSLLSETTTAETDEGIRDLLRGHRYELCARLHPEEASCLRNYGRALLYESWQVGKWVGAFSVLPFVISKARRESTRR